MVNKNHFMGKTWELSEEKDMMKIKGYFKIIIIY